MICDCGKPAETDSDTCFRCRVATVGIRMQGGAIGGNSGWKKTKNEWMLENLGTTDDRELGRRGIERAPS